MTSILVLTLLDFTLPFVLECDVRSDRIEVVLMERGKPIAFASRVISRRARGLSTYEKELIVIV